MKVMRKKILFYKSLCLCCCDEQKTTIKISFRAHLHMEKNLPMNIRRLVDEEFFFIQDFFKNIKFAKANQQVLKN